ncbi:MAG: ATP-binding protein [Planctomycetota bacterium]
MKRLSIRWRLTLWYAGSLAVVLTAFCISLLLLTRQQLLARTDAALREELKELVLEVRLAHTSLEFTEHLYARFFQHDIYDFLITDRQGKILFASSGLTPPQAAALVPSNPLSTSEFFNREPSDNLMLRVAGTTVTAPQGTVSAQAMTSLAPLQTEMLTLQLLMSVLLPLGLVLALAGGYFLAARALAPVEQITSVAATITISNLHQRIAITNADDELGHLAATLNSLIARLERAVDEIQRFTADASHELRTPLAVLRSEAESALRMRRSPVEYEQTLTTVVEEATRLGHLADQLLNLSRHDAGITELRREPIHLGALLLDVADQLRPIATEKNITLDTSAVTHCEALGDDLLLGRALFNVIENAIKYTPHSGNVTLHSALRGNTAVLQIQDTGIGIPQEHLLHVFDRFYRVDPSRNATTGGTGLGLAIARSAIQLHGGEITIASEIGVGTTLTIELPGTTAPSEAEPLPSSEPTAGRLDGVAHARS